MKKNILRIISLLSLLFFFFPFFAISWDYKKTTYSGLDLAIGHGMSPYSTGYSFVFILLLIPIIFLAISLYSKKRERIAALVSSTTGVIILFVISTIAGATSKKQGFELTTKSGFFLYLLTSVASIVFILYEFLLENPAPEKPSSFITGGDFITRENLAKVENTLPLVNIEERITQLSKIRNLYENKIFSTEEFNVKKTIWIGCLKYYRFEAVEMDFLSELLPYVNDCIISPEELTKIKYLVSQEYVDVRNKAAIDEKQSEEDFARSKRQEMVATVKEKTKDGINGAISKFNGALSSAENVISNSVQRKEQRNNSLKENGLRNDKDALIHENIQDSINVLSRCVCGEAIDPTMTFCTNCGKQNP